MSTKTENLASVAYLCRVLGVLPDRIERAARSLGIDPAMTLNGTAHYDSDQAERIREFLKQYPGGVRRSKRQRTRSEK